MPEGLPAFLDIVDTIGGSWVRLTYDTPLSQLPIIGLKSSLNPLGGFYRKRYHLPDPKADEKDKLLPASPEVGPPLPRGLKQKWPWNK